VTSLKSISSVVKFQKTHKMEIITLTHGKCSGTTCEIYKYGATVTSWKVAGGENNIFVSKKAKLDGTKAIRGGVPVCFPQFGPWEFGAQHGFARISKDWKVTSGPVVDEISGDAKVILCLEDTAETRKTWDKAFRLLYTITLSANSLRMDVEVENTNDNPGDILPLTFALHTYFNVPDVEKCRIDGGFKGLTFRDKTVDGHPDKVENREAITLSEFTDRVYYNAPDTCVLNGMHGGKVLKLEKSSGMADWVIWNPWAEGASKMGDMDDEEYHQFVCVEAVQTSKTINVKASGEKDKTWKASHVLTLIDAGSKL